MEETEEELAVPFDILFRIPKESAEETNIVTDIFL